MSVITVAFILTILRIMLKKSQKRLYTCLSELSYPIFLGQNIHSVFKYFDLHAGQHVLIVTNDYIAPLYLQTITSTMQSNKIKVDHLILPDGEQHKTIDSWQYILNTLLENNYPRTSCLLALGGGVIGDLTGFAAATYLRGVRYIQLPTTLLSQIDSSIGGKTAVNHPLGKNMVGAFHQPDRVIIDINTLKTLSKRQFCAGLAEVIKYGIILDHQFFSWLEENIDKLMAMDENTLIECISHCCQLKAHIIQQDEHETGIRAILNFGHTFGHAIEALTNFSNWLHGEAVAVGMLMAAQASLQLGLLNVQDIHRIKTLLRRAHLPTTRPKNFNEIDYIPLMKRDKKRLSSSLRLILARQLGHVEIMEIDDETLILQAIRCV